jgi:uracil-DNA glycosylase
MFESVKQYLPPGVWEKLHQQVMPKAGGMAAAENRRAAAQDAQTTAQSVTENAQAQATQQEVNAEQGIGKQEIPSGMNNVDQTAPDQSGGPECPPCPPCPAAGGSGPEQSPSTPSNSTVQQSQKSADVEVDLPAQLAKCAEIQKAGGCQKVFDNCMKMKEDKEGESATEAKADCEKARGACQDMKKEEVTKGLQDSEKSKLGAEIKTKSTKDLTTYNWRLAQQQGQGNTLTGFSQADMNWFRAQIKQELNSRKDDTSKSESETLTPTEADIEKCHFNTVDDIKERATSEEKKSATKKEVQKTDADAVGSFVGRRAQVLFIAASPSPNDTIRKSAMTGKPGRIFDDRYLMPLNLTRDDIGFMYLVPRLRKNDNGTPREPTVDEIEKWSEWFDTELNRIEKGKRMVRVALGHTVKKALGRDIDYVLPHPILLELGVPRAEQEFQRKRLMLAKSLEARIRKN